MNVVNAVCEFWAPLGWADWTIRCYLLLYVNIETNDLLFREAASLTAPYLPNGAMPLAVLDLTPGLAAIDWAQIYDIRLNAPKKRPTEIGHDAIRPDRCPYCGVRLHPGQRRCDGCGAPL